MHLRKLREVGTKQFLHETQMEVTATTGQKILFLARFEPWNIEFWLR